MTLETKFLSEPVCECAYVDALMCEVWVRSALLLSCVFVPVSVRMTKVERMEECTAGVRGDISADKGTDCDWRQIRMRCRFIASVCYPLDVTRAQMFACSRKTGKIYGNKN